jgi:hypothetical protein
VGNSTVSNEVSTGFILVSDNDNLFQKENEILGPWPIGDGGLPVFQLEVLDVFGTNCRSRYSVLTNPDGCFLL